MNDFLAAIVTAVQTPPASPMIQPSLAPHFALMPDIAGDSMAVGGDVGDPLFEAVGMANGALPGAPDVIPPLLPLGVYDDDTAHLPWSEAEAPAFAAEPGDPASPEAPSRSTISQPVFADASADETSRAATIDESARRSDFSRSAQTTADESARSNDFSRSAQTTAPEVAPTNRSIFRAASQASRDATANENGRRSLPRSGASPDVPNLEAASHSGSERSPLSGSVAITDAVSAPEPESAARTGATRVTPGIPPDADATRITAQPVVPAPAHSSFGTSPLKASDVVEPAAANRPGADAPKATLRAADAHGSAGATLAEELKPGRTEHEVQAGSKSHPGAVAAWRATGAPTPESLWDTDPKRVTFGMEALVGRAATTDESARSNDFSRSAQTTTDKSARSNDFSRSAQTTAPTDATGAVMPDEVKPRALPDSQTNAPPRLAAGAPLEATRATRSRIRPAGSRRAGVTPVQAQAGEAIRHAAPGHTAEAASPTSEADAKPTTSSLPFVSMARPRSEIPRATLAETGAAAAENVAQAGSLRHSPVLRAAAHAVSGATDDEARRGSSLRAGARPANQMFRAANESGMRVDAGPMNDSDTARLDPRRPRPMLKAVRVPEQTAPVTAEARDSTPEHFNALVRQTERAATSGSVRTPSIIRPVPEAPAAVTGRTAASGRSQVQELAPAESLPTIRVTIGRIEVRARSTEAAPVPARPMPRPPMSLDAYLGRAARGNR